jgi:hypothetical protein
MTTLRKNQLLQSSLTKSPNRTYYILLAILVLALSSMACDIYYSLSCRLMDGGKWVYDSNSYDWYCDTSQTDQDKGEPSISTSRDLAACLPNNEDYRLEITNLSDESNTKKRSCNARGSITNIGDQELMFAVYRVNHFGAEETFGERWMGAGFQSLSPGETVEYGRFHRCTGGNCGEGEWFYIEKISLLYRTDECLDLAFAQEDKIPESIIPVEDPCDW